MPDNKVSIVDGAGPISKRFVTSILTQIGSQENESRKKISLREDDVYRDKLHRYVQEYLRDRAKFSANTLNEIPIVDSINLAKRIVNQEASIYKNAPKRDWEGVTDGQKEDLKQMYEDFHVNQKLKAANQAYKLQGQTHLMVIPKDGGLALRVLRNHNLDVIPDPRDPEKGLIYIINAFDQQKLYDEIPEDNRNYYNDIDGTGTNEAIADSEDYKSVLNKYVIWSKDFNFIMDEKGNLILDEEDFDEDGNLREESILNPLRDLGIIPIIDISVEKNFTYFVGEGNAVVDFTIAYNGDWSMLAQVQKMQGFSQAIVKGDPEALPTDMQIGPNFILHLPTVAGPNGNPIETDFQYVSPSPDLPGNLSILQAKLASFLTSRGLDPDTVTSNTKGTNFSSGLERLLAMVEKFDASRDDYDLFERIEDKLYNIIRGWLNTLSDTDLLKDKYKIGKLNDDSEISIIYEKPELVKTEKEVAELQAFREEKNYQSHIDSIEEIYNVDRDAAILIADRIMEDKKELASKTMDMFGLGDEAPADNEDEDGVPETEAEPNGSQSDV